MKPIDPNQPTIEMRYRTLLILWFAICMSVLLLLVLVLFTPVTVAGNPQLTVILNGLAVVPMGISFLFKRQMLGQAVAEQSLDRVQSAYVMAFALCEASALLGLLDHFLNGSRYYFVGFMFAALGMLLHFPRKQHLLDASQKQF